MVTVRLLQNGNVRAEVTVPAVLAALPPDVRDREIEVALCVAQRDMRAAFERERTSDMPQLRQTA